MWEFNDQTWFATGKLYDLKYHGYSFCKKIDIKVIQYNDDG